MELIPGKLYKVSIESCWACHRNKDYDYFMELPYLPKGAIVMYTGKLIEQQNKRYYEFLYKSQNIYITYLSNNGTHHYGLRIL